MEAFKTYLNEVGWYIIADIVVMLVAAVLLFIFFKRKKNVRMAILFSFFMLVYLAVNISVALTSFHALLITKYILDGVLIFLFAAFAVVYQNELKLAFARLAKGHEKGRSYVYDSTDEELRLAAGEIVKACQNLSKNDTGALIIIAPTNPPQNVLSSGTILNAVISASLIESVFNTKAPLHDGAVVIQENRVLAAGCFLPLSENTDISKELGTRHRAAIGITETNDVFAIVVSEETGIISVVQSGRIKRYMTPEKLYEEIENVYGINYLRKRGKR